MQPSTVQLLIELNRQFYCQFGASFAATRRRLQPGAQRALEGLPLIGRWLDLGCGNGQVARLLAARGFNGTYLGLDFSPALLEEARRGQPEGCSGFTPRFEPADLSGQWISGLAPRSFDVILCLAVLHHLPGEASRLSLLRQARSVVADGGVLIHSEWQFQHSPKLMARRLPWETAGLRDEDVEPGDTLLDWRADPPGQPQRPGLRYVHLFTTAELERLAQVSGFRVADSFESDGHGGRLALYQVWTPDIESTVCS